MQYLTFFIKGKISLYNIGLKNEKEKKLEEKIFRRGDFSPKSVAKKGYTPSYIFFLHFMSVYLVKTVVKQYFCNYFKLSVYIYKNVL